MANLTSSINRRYFYFLLKSNSRFMLLYGFGLLIGFPILCASLNYTTNIEGLYYAGKVINLLIALVATVLVPLLMFRYTTSKTSLDVYHSLPIGKEDLFFNHYAAGVVMLVIPLAISWFTGIFVSSLLGANIVLTSELIGFLLICISLLVSYSITIFAKNNCGTILDSFIYTIVLHLIPILAYVTYYAYCSDMLLGFSEPFSTDIFYYLTPIPATFVQAFRGASQGFTSVPSAAIWFYVAVIVGLYVVSSKFYVTLKSEKTQMAFVNDYFYPIVSFISTMIAIVLIHTIMNSAFEYNGGSSYVFPLLVGTIFYLILDVIANRGFKHFTKSLIRIAIICGVVLAIIVPVKMTNGFGYITRTPKLESIDSVSLSIGYPFSSYLKINNYSDMAEFTKKEDIQSILETHQLILEKYKGYGYDENQLNRNYQQEYSSAVPMFKDTYFSSNSITLRYDLGLTSLKRQYQTNPIWLTSLFTLATSEPMISLRYPMLTTQNKYILDTVSLSDEYDFGTVYVNHVDFTKLKEALRQDLLKETSNQFFEDHHELLGYLTLNGIMHVRNGNEKTQIPIKSYYKNTLAYLTSIGASIPNVDLTASTFTTIKAIIPDVPNTSTLFYFGDLTEGKYMEDTYQYTFKDITKEEFIALEPYMHFSIMTKEPNILIYFQLNGQMKQRMIRYKDLGIVNTIVKGQGKKSMTSIYELIYTK